MPSFIAIVNNTCAKEQGWNKTYLNTDRVELITEREDGGVVIVAVTGDQRVNFLVTSDLTVEAVKDVVEGKRRERNSTIYAKAITP